MSLNSSPGDGGGIAACTGGAAAGRIGGAATRSGGEGSVPTSIAGPSGGSATTEGTVAGGSAGVSRSGFRPASFGVGAPGGGPGFKAGLGGVAGSGRLAVGRSGNWSAGAGLGTGIGVAAGTGLAGAKTTGDGVGLAVSEPGAGAGFGTANAAGACPPASFPAGCTTAGGTAMTVGPGSRGWTKWKIKLPATPTATA